MNGRNEVWDAIGVGVGPANLSLAALLAPLSRLSARFYERRERFSWHPGLLLDGAGIQVSFLKDLVTLVDPTSRFSFLSFLHDQGRLYSFLNADFPRTRRIEFDQYYRWASERLESVQLGIMVEAVRCDDGRLWVETSDGPPAATRNVVIGTGAQPAVPDFATAYLGPGVYHASQYLARRGGASGRHTVVVGGGQTGAEVILDLLRLPEPPSALTWVSRRANFLPLDESPFTNEWFTPAYSRHFFGLENGMQRSALETQKLASDGISPDLLCDLYRTLYEMRYLRPRECAWSFCPDREVVHLAPGPAGGWSLEARRLADGVTETLRADVVILATGFRHCLPSCLEPLEGRLDLRDGMPQLEEDFSLAWDGPPDCTLFVQGGDGLHHGISARNLSLNAWRSGVIANRIAAEELYVTQLPEPFVCWGDGQTTIEPVPMRISRAGGGGEP